MAHTIWKFTIPVTLDTFELELPIGARFLALQMRRIPQAWFLLDPLASKEIRRFVVARTGYPVLDAYELLYLGTIQSDVTDHEFHVFERT